MDNPQLDRRSLLKMGALAVAGTAIPRGANGRHDAAQNAPELDTLPKVHVAANRIAREVAGLRPFRASGFVVRAEALGDKTIIHNYGHGGCGVTLSWGTSDMAVNLALQTTKRTAAVIGCGIVGLTTARLLQDRGFQVKIYTRDVPPNTTSNIAGAMFGVTSLVDDDHHTAEITANIQQAVRFAHRYFQNFVGERYSVHWNEMFLIGDDPQELPWDFTITPELFPVTTYSDAENPFGTKYAISFNTMMIEPFTYLPQIMSDFFMRGGTLEIRAFANAQELAALQEPLIFNCTGLGAQDLVDDKELVPVKGQLTLLMPQPEINYAYLDGRRDFYMFARHDVIILGGSHEPGVSSLEPNPTRSAEILAGHMEIVAKMK